MPYTIVICFMCKSLWTVLSEEYEKEHGIIPRQYNHWRTGVIDVLDYPTFHVQQVRQYLVSRCCDSILARMNQIAASCAASMRFARKALCILSA